MILVIDNYDSFTYNLVQYLGEFAGPIEVVRNDAITVQEIKKLNPSHIVLSPGPCTPNEAGCSLEVSRELSSHFPILGVCLGHQAIAQAFGADVVQAEEIIHGKTSRVEHNSSSIFVGVEQHFIATRYHSLVVDPDTIPDHLEILAWSTPSERPGGPQKREIMALRHRDYPNTIGLQFHPESILTSVGKQLLSAFLSL